jgi:hypothetical protein
MLCSLSASLLLFLSFAFSISAFLRSRPRLCWLCSVFLFLSFCAFSSAPASCLSHVCPKALQLLSLSKFTLTHTRIHSLSLVLYLLSQCDQRYSRLVVMMSHAHSLISNDEQCCRYAFDTMNVFDAFIVIMSWVEYIIGSEGGLSVLRAFRIMRIFKLIRFMPGLQVTALSRTPSALPLCHCDHHSALCLWYDEINGIQELKIYSHADS